MSKELYDIIPVILGALIAIMGILMIACPKIMVKKEFRENTEQLAKTKKNGIFEIICGIALIIIWLI